MKNKKKENKITKATEPQPHYGTTDANKRIRIFSSFQEENEFVAKERAALSHNERMLNAEELRKSLYYNYLLENGTWPAIVNVFEIMPPYIHAVSE